MITGRVVVAQVMSAAGGKFKVSIASKYGKIVLPLSGATKETKEKLAQKLVHEVIPNSEMIGTIGTNAVFTAPKTWKGGVNA